MKHIISALLLTASFGISNPVDANQKHVTSVTSHDKKAKKSKKKIIGMASWYGIQHHGKKTASGEIFDMYALSAANKTIPLGTKVKVTNLKNGKEISLRITDRGPYAKGRILDLSYEAAKQLDMIKSGEAKISIEIL